MTKTQTLAKPISSFTPAPSGNLQRKCACGAKTSGGAKCSKCHADDSSNLRLRRKTSRSEDITDVPQIVNEVIRSPGQPLDTSTRSFIEPRFGHDFNSVRSNADVRAPRVGYSPSRIPVMQRKLTIGASNDPLELEADRVADQVMAAPTHSTVRAASPRIQRYAGQTTKGAETVPASVDHMLASSGRPLESVLQEDMGQRFGHDFSRVRVHYGEAAEQSARDVSAHAYTVGHNIVFGAGRFAPGTYEGRRLLAHELTHVVQQTGANSTNAGQVQRTIGDGHDLAAPRFTGNVTLEAAFDGELSLRRGATGDPVRLIQESLREMGYALPLSVSSVLPGRMDGIFGPETEAAVKRFQSDASALLIDGIVGPETMGLLDTHDVSRPTARPPAITGPVPAPLAATDCNAQFTGVTFALANQVASGTATPAIISIATVTGRPFLRMRGNTPITYHPDITITAPNSAAASQFRVGFTQTLLNSSRVAEYSGGATVATIVPTLPIKDGAPNNYHPIFVTNPAPNIVEDFTATGATANLNWPDVPGDGAFVNLNDNPSCAGAALPAQIMTRMRMNDQFRIWVVVQHLPSGCVRALHHVDWNLNWSANVAMAAGVPTVAVTSNVNNVTESNGNGSPRFIQGGNVPGAIAVKACI